MLNLKSILFSFVLLIFTIQIVFAQHNAITINDDKIKSHKTIFSSTNETNIKPSKQKNIIEIENETANKVHEKELEIAEIKSMMEATDSMKKLRELSKNKKKLFTELKDIKLAGHYKIKAEQDKIIKEMIGEIKDTLKSKEKEQN